MASLSGRSLRVASRVIVQAAGSQCGRIACQIRSPRLQTSQALHQITGMSLAQQAQRQFVVSMSRTISSCMLLSTVVPGSLTSPGGNADVADSSVGGDDDGLVITAPQKWEDL